MKSLCPPWGLGGAWGTFRLSGGKLRNRLGTAACLLGGLPAVPAQVQAADDPPITVTASRIRLPQADRLEPTTTLPADTLDQRGLTNWPMRSTRCPRCADR